MFCDVRTNEVSKVFESRETYPLQYFMIIPTQVKKKNQQTRGRQSQPDMAPPTNRQEILDQLRSQVAKGHAIVGAGAGIGLSAKFVEEGGGDLIIIYNSGRFRMAGRGSLAGLMPYGNANDVVLDMASRDAPTLS